MEARSSAVTIAEVTDLSEEELDAFEALFVLNMSNDLAALSICGGDKDLIGPMARAMISAATLGGAIYSATVSDGDVVGYAVWMPPGQELLTTPEQRKLGWDDFWAKLSQQGKDWFSTVYPREVTAFMDDIFGPKGKLNAWYLNIIMVHPQHQKRGIATRFMDAVRQKASAEGAMMALSTSNPRNVPIYRALRFDLRGDKEVPSPWGNWPLYVFTQK